MKQFKSPSLVLLSSLIIRAVVRDASIGEALAVAAVSGLYAYTLYLESKKEAPINDTVKKEVADLRAAVNTIKVARTIGRV